ncbi:MAG TPA: hypothetical protein DDY71_11105 [Spirochaetia bacterium]|nr:hypothetical protein [Spirochaetia bacterium]
MNNKNWFGTLTINNIELIANNILEILSGKKYIFVDVYEYLEYKPHTRINQKLENGSSGSPLSVYYDEHKKYAGFNFCDTYGIWGCSTSTQEDRYDPSFTNPYIVIEWNQITVKQKTPAGMMCYWQITVVEEDDL